MSMRKLERTAEGIFWPVLTLIGLLIIARGSLVFLERHGGHPIGHLATRTQELAGLR